MVFGRNLGISARNDFAMLKEIGGECAGAVTFSPTGDRLPENRNSHRTLSSSELAVVLRELRKRPLLAGQEGIRHSLAGAQDKVPVCLIGDEISLSLYGAPSTHVLKPAVERFEGVVQNESLCMRLAAAIGLPTAKVQARSVEGVWISCSTIAKTESTAKTQNTDQILKDCTKRTSVRLWVSSQR